MPVPVVRQATLEDLPGIAALHRLVREECLPYLPHLRTVDEDRVYFRESVFADCKISVALEHGVVVGYCATRPGWVDHLYVLPSWHRRGLGSTFIDLAKRDQDQLSLWVFFPAQYTRHSVLRETWVSTDQDDRRQRHRGTRTRRTLRMATIC